ncbi:MAG TPA: hypothetical protein VNZ52_11820 [Candidatus Thermoplasmatota archaeon]|nr:hypothetical protein [Candidatus Thermoplasmatota archaeon]
MDLIRAVAANPNQYPDRFIAIPLRLVPKILTEERIRLLEVLRSEGPFNTVQEAADAVGRDVTRVSRDLKELVVVGLATAERHGRAKRIEALNVPILLA